MSRTGVAATAAAQQGVLEQLAGRVLELAQKEGADAAEVSLSRSSGLSVTVRAGELETVEFNDDQGFAITVYKGDRKGGASTSDGSEASIAETVRRACDIARYTEADACQGLADPEYLARQPMDLDLDHPWPISVDEATELARRSEAAALAESPQIFQCDGAQVSTGQGLRVYATSNGFLGSVVSGRHGLSCVAIARDNTGMQRDYWYSSSRRHELLEEPEHVGTKAARRAASRLGAGSVTTTSAPVLFVPEMASGLISALLGAISGGSQYRKASFLLGSLGTSVAASHLSIEEQPFLPGAMASGWFDSDGVATSAKAFIDKGQVASYLLGSYSARRLGMTTTGNAGGAHNVIISGNTRPADALVKDMNRGLIVTELMGQGVNAVTGDYSRGAAGFWVENGEITGPVEEITIASNLKDMMMNLVAIGDDPDLRGGIRAPSMLVEEMTIAGG